MKVYIKSAASVSPQKTFENPLFLDGLAEHTGNRLTCIEPDYNGIIEPKLIRRMSRIIKMSVAATTACLKQAAIENPDAIVTGTAYGCLEDTGTFLTNLIAHNEGPVTPTAFVQSTHNTIGAQIALLLQCKQYNNTFVSGGASFENALLDAMMFLAEHENSNVLVGGMDEITDMSHTILTRMGLYKRRPVSNLDLFDSVSKGTIAGEGAAFFILKNTPSDNDLACIDGVYTFYKPDGVDEIEQHISSFFTGQSIAASEIDLLIAGNNGDLKNDKIYTQVQQSVLKDVTSLNYKHLCGEYPTSAGFALWLAVNIVKNQSIPEVLSRNKVPGNEIKKVLIYNHWQNEYHSLILVSSC